MEELPAKSILAKYVQLIFETYRKKQCCISPRFAAGAQLDTLSMDAQQPWKKKGGTASWMAAAGALESGDSELEPRLQLLHGHARVIIACRLPP